MAVAAAEMIVAMATTTKVNIVVVPIKNAHNTTGTSNFQVKSHGS